MATPPSLEPWPIDPGAGNQDRLAAARGGTVGAKAGVTGPGDGWIYAGLCSAACIAGPVTG